MTLYIASKMKMVDDTGHTWLLMVDPAGAWYGDGRAWLDLPLPWKALSDPWLGLTMLWRITH